MPRKQGSSTGKLTAGDGWKAPRSIPYRIILLALVALLAIVGAGWVILHPAPEAPVVAEVNGPEPYELSSVDIAGISTLLNQFATTPREMRGDIAEGTLRVKVIASMTGDGRSGFGTINTANIDASALLAEGITYLKGSPTFWSAMGVQTNWAEWVRVEDGFLGNRIFLPSNIITAALTPVEESRILGDDYIASAEARATFGPIGLERISLAGFEVNVIPSNDDAIVGTAGPMFGALGTPADLVRNGSVWVVNPPPPPEP